MCDVWGCPASGICFSPTFHHSKMLTLRIWGMVPYLPAWQWLSSWARGQPQRRGVGRAKHNSWRIFVIISYQWFHRSKNQLKTSLTVAWFLSIANLGKYCRGRLLLLQPDVHVHLQEPLLAPQHTLGVWPLQPFWSHRLG